MNLNQEWQDCVKFWPYKDYQGKWKFPNYTQFRLRGGVVEYREREETNEELLDRQW